MGKRSEEIFYKRGSPSLQNCMETCLASSLIREIQNNVKMKYTAHTKEWLKSIRLKVMKVGDNVK